MSSDSEKLDSRTLVELKKHIKADAKAHIQSCLSRVKENQQCCKRFVKAGGLKLLVHLLRYQDQKIINAALSILANVCLNSDHRQQVQDTKIVSYTLWILNNLEVGDTLHCRACRLIGNLSDCNSYAKAFYDAGAIQSLNYVLRTKANPQTYLMAIRAIRNIWSMYDGSHRKIIESGVIRSITSILINAGKKTESKYVDLVESCMKAMLAFLNGSNNECANQMVGEKKEGFRTLVKFYEAQNKVAIKCVYYLAMIPECRPSLGDCDAVEATVLLVKSCTFYLKEIIASLCLFCREAVNRIRIRYCDGLQVILNLLKKEDYERYHPLLLHGLAQFVCDDESILIMVKNGLLDILTSKLQKMSIEVPDETDEKATPKKRAADRSPYRKVEVKFNRTNSGRFSLDYPHDDWSPKSSRSDSITPPSTPPMKLLGDVEDADIEDVAEENYSPVCSDNEWSDHEPQEEVESLKSFSSATIEVEEAQEKVSKIELNKHINAWTLVLLSKLSYSDEPIDRLADPATIGPLATYVRLAKNPKASRILVRIVKNKAYLMPLIKQGFVFEVQNLSGHEQYTRQLCALAETGGAVGELSSILLRGQETHRLVIAVSIPFLIKSKDVLRQLLKNYGGLPLIFDVLSNSEHSLHKEAIWAICQLADSLDVRPEGIEKGHPMESNFVYSDATLGIENHVKPSTVTFELDDGTTVDACRRLLCQRSEAFSAMLEGNFSESGKRCVKLRKTSKEGLNTLLLAANGSDFDHRTIESLLDAVVLADKFLMADISELLTESSISKLNYENCCRAWSWARDNQCYELKMCSVKSFLTGNMTRAQRVRAFKEFSTNENFKEFLDEVKDIISNVLVQR